MLSSYYYPERIASSHLTDDMEDAYTDAGLTISVFTPTPTRGISNEIYREYQNKRYDERKEGQIIVHRFPMFREGKNPVLRALRYFLIHFKHYGYALKQKDVDVICAGSTPPTQGMMCCMAAKRLTKKLKRKIPVVFSLQDVFPDSLVTSGITKEGSLLWKIGRKIENYTYRNVDVIRVISEDIKENIIKKGVPAEKIHVIRNWVDARKVKSVAWDENSLAKELNIREDAFKIVYAGNLGKSQGCGIILEAAKRMKPEADVEFLVFGYGAEEAELKKTSTDNGLTNVRFFPLQAPERISEVYSLGDVCLISCKKGTGAGAFPSKTASITATGTPVLASFDSDSELCRMLQKYRAGITTEPENAEALVEAIRAMKNDRNELREMGNHCRILCETEFSKEICTTNIVDLVIDTIENKSDVLDTQERQRV